MFAKQWLDNKGLTSNVDVVLFKNMLTSELRKSEILDPNGKFLIKVFETWPVLQGFRGFELVDFYLILLVY